MGNTEAIAVVIPAYNAEATIGPVIDRVRRAAPQALIVVVDDGSRDASAQCAKDAGAEVVWHADNQGKGRALALGIDEALKRSSVEALITIDADGQHPPERLSDLIGGLEAADLVIGARPRDPAIMPFGRRCTNWLSSTLVSRLTGMPVPDSQSGFRAMTRAVAETVRPEGKRYEFETEFLLEAARRGFRIGSVEVPAVYEGSVSHFRYVSDTMRLSRVFARQWKGIVFPTTHAPRPTHGLS